MDPTVPSVYSAHGVKKIKTSDVFMSDVSVIRRLFPSPWCTWPQALLAEIRFSVILLFDILFMFLGLTNPKICILVNAVVDNLCKITELRKRQLKAEILHNLKEL